MKNYDVDFAGMIKITADDLDEVSLEAYENYYSRMDNMDTIYDEVITRIGRNKYRVNFKAMIEIEVGNGEDPYTVFFDELPYGIEVEKIISITPSK